MGDAPLVLWDIDGTLLRARGVGTLAFVTAIEQVTGRRWVPRRLDLGGRTDAEIAMRILEEVGVAADEPQIAEVLAAVAAAYPLLASELRSNTEQMPGVAEALAALDAAHAVQTVVTGNVRAGAEAKLAAAGLDGPLELDVGAFGSDHRDRSALVGLAIGRVAGTGRRVMSHDAWVIGDTPRDLHAARANGIRCALVATGTFAAPDLRGLGADLVLDDLTSADALFETLIG